jgi:predicted  nucleic acid-binding Zn-ribbon protein
MRDQIAILLELRKLDDQLRALHRQLEARQAEWQRRKLEADLVRETLSQEEGRLEAAARRRREADLEVKTCRARKVQLETQLQAVKTNVEYQAMLKEIATMDTKARGWEDVILEAMEQEEATQRTASRLRTDLEEKERNAGQEAAQVEQELAAVRAQEHDLESRRTQLFEGLTAQARNKYERLRAVKGETAIVAVVRGSCGGCHYNLPPQTVNEVRKNEQLILCEGCGRILVWVNG